MISDEISPQTEAPEVVLVAILGLTLSVIIERFLRPRPFPRRPAGIWEAHAGLWCAFYGSIVLLSGRPWCALAATSAVLITLALVNNVKMRSLHEPLVFQDYEFFYDTLVYPRLFLPFFGLKNFLRATAFFLLAIAGLYCEPVPINRFALNGQFGGLLIVLGAAALLLLRACRHDPTLSFKTEQDMRLLGLLGSLWAYGRAKRVPPNMRSPFEAKDIWIPKPNPAPHLVAILQESFFDARTIYDGIRPDILASFDTVRAESSGYGPLEVSAWGGNTVRTEFAFLTGVAEEDLGAHRFNPYQAVVSGKQVASLPMFLKGQSYRTICIHPYFGHFYFRDKVCPKLGFDEFLDIRSFAGGRRAGPYMSDAEVGEKIIRVLREASCPTFVFAITMESHGPLHLEHVNPSDVEKLYTSPPPSDCDDLTIYLRHLRNADEMLGSLRTAFLAMNTPVELCCFGDHVPIMPKDYASLKEPDGTVPYLCWSSRRKQKDVGLKFFTADAANTPTPLPARLLAPFWLRSIQKTAAPPTSYSISNSIVNL